MEIEKTVLYLLGLLETEEKNLFEQALLKQPELQAQLQASNDILRRVHRIWLNQHIRKWVEDEEKLQLHLQEIIDSVLGDIDPKIVARLQTELADVPSLQAFFDDLQILKAGFQEVDRPDPIQILKAFTKKRDEIPPQPILHPAWGLRGETHLPVELTIAPEYGFYIKLYFAGLDHKRPFVQGQIVPASQENQTLLNELVGARVWLIPTLEKGWYESQVNTQGEFSFNKVAPGKYTFEMAWLDHFLEVFDLSISSV